MNLGGADDSIVIGSTSSTTLVRLGGGTNAVTVVSTGLGGRLNLVADGTGNTLTFDDKLAPNDVSITRHLTVTRGVFETKTVQSDGTSAAGQPVTFDPAAYATFTLDLANASNRVSVTDLSIPTATINGGNQKTPSPPRGSESFDVPGR